MTRHPFLRPLPLVVALCLVSARADATRCGFIGPPCEEYVAADAVFIGRVVATSVDSAGRPSAAVDVVRIVKGALGSRVVVHGAWSNRLLGAGPRGYEIPAGDYVFYALMRDGRLDAGACSRTAPIATAAADLGFFDDLAAGRAHIVGSVRRVDDPFEPAGPYELVVEGEDGMRRVVRPTSGGEFDIDGVAGGTYRVTIVTLDGAAVVRRTITVRLCDGDCRRIDFLVFEPWARALSAEALPRAAGARARGGCRCRAEARRAGRRGRARPR